MSRLPTVAGDNDGWGTVLNDFLSVSHNPDGTLKTTASGSPIYVDLREFVAFDQTGISSISTVLNDAITQAAATGGRARVYIPPSTSANPLLIDTQITLKSNVVVEGAGTKLKAANGLSTSIFRATTISNAGMIGIDVDGNNSGASGLDRILYGTNCTNFTVDRCNFHDSAGNNGALQFVDTTGVRIRHSTVTHGSNSIELVNCPHADLSDLYVSSARSLLHGAGGIYLGNCDHTAVTRVRSTGNICHGMYVLNSEYVKVAHSRFDTNGLVGAGYADEGWRRGITLSQSNPNLHFSIDHVLLDNNVENGIIVPEGNDYFTASHCRALDNNTMASVGGHGFEVNGEHCSASQSYSKGNNCGFSVNGHAVIIDGCHAWSNSGGFGNGIKVYNSDGTAITNCKTYSNGSSGIDINADTATTSTGISVIGCESYSNTGNGLFVSDEIINPILRSNYLHDNTSANLSVATPYLGDPGGRSAQAGNYTIVRTDPDVIGVTSTASPRTITLPAANAVVAGRAYTVKDESGGAATNNITVQRAGSDNINGGTTTVINTNYGSVTVYSDGTSKWFTV